MLGNVEESPFRRVLGGKTNKNVALGSKHALGGIIDEYTDANKCQLADPAKKQCDIRDQMEAVMKAKKHQIVEKKETPKKKVIPGEVQQKKNSISPSEVRKLNEIIKVHGLEMDKMREIDR